MASPRNNNTPLPTIVGSLGYGKKITNNNTRIAINPGDCMLITSPEHGLSMTVDFRNPKAEVLNCDDPTDDFVEQYFDVVGTFPVQAKRTHSLVDTLVTHRSESYNPYRGQSKEYVYKSFDFEPNAFHTHVNFTGRAIWEDSTNTWIIGGESREVFNINTSHAPELQDNYSAAVWIRITTKRT